MVSMKPFEAYQSVTYRWRTAEGNCFVTIVRSPEDGTPVKIFAHVGKAGTAMYAAGDGLSALVRLAFRSGADMEDVVRYLVGISHEGTNSLVFDAASMPEAIGKSLRQEYLQ